MLVGHGLRCALNAAPRNREPQAPHRPPDQLGPDQIRSYQVYLLKERKLSVRTVGHHTAALRFFFCKTLKRAYPIEEVPYPKAPRRLPTVLTRGEAIRLIDSASNLF